MEDRAHPQTHSETSGDDDPEADEDRGETHSLCALGNVGGAGRGGKRRGAHRSAGNDYSPKSTPYSQQGASPIFSTKFLKCAMLTVSWFGLSTALALFNKQVFGRRHGGFPAPLFLTSVQFLIQFLLADFSLKYLAPSLMPKMPIPWGVYFTQVAPVGVAMGLDIGLSNLSLVYVTVSFYTLAKTSSILFLLVFSFALRTEPISARLTGVVMMLMFGEFLTVHGETQFNARGFALCIIASACSGIRWVLSQRVLHGRGGPEKGSKGSAGGSGSGSGSCSGSGVDGGGVLRRSYGMHSPPVILRAVMPVMCVVVFLFSCAKERWWVTLPGSPWLDDPKDVLVDLGITTAGAAMAFIMSMSEFELVKETTAVSVMVIGTGKDVVTVLVSIVVFGDVFGTENFIGLFFIICGIVAGLEIVFRVSGFGFRVLGLVFRV